MTVPYGDIFNGSTIYAHVPTTIFLGNQNNRNSTRTKALTYIPAVQKVLDLMLDLLSLLRVGPISSSVWQTRSRYQVDLVLNPSNRWQAWRYLGRKNVRILLQKVSDHRRQSGRQIIQGKQGISAYKGIAYSIIFSNFSKVSFCSKQNRIFQFNLVGNMLNFRCNRSLIFVMSKSFSILLDNFSRGLR